MNTNQLKAIAAQAAEDLTALVTENAEQILNDISTTARAKALNESPCKINLAFAIALDLDNSKQTNSLKWSVANVRTAEHEMPDPNQPELTINN